MTYQHHLHPVLGEKMKTLTTALWFSCLLTQTGQENWRSEEKQGDNDTNHELIWLESGKVFTSPKISLYIF